MNLQLEENAADNRSWTIADLPPRVWFLLHRWPWECHMTLCRYCCGTLTVCWVEHPVLYRQKHKNNDTSFIQTPLIRIIYLFGPIENQLYDYLNINRKWLAYLNIQIFGQIYLSSWTILTIASLLTWLREPYGLLQVYPTEICVCQLLMTKVLKRFLI